MRSLLKLPFFTIPFWRKAMERLEENGRNSGFSIHSPIQYVFLKSNWQIGTSIRAFGQWIQSILSHVATHTHPRWNQGTWGAAQGTWRDGARLLTIRAQFCCSQTLYCFVFSSTQLLDPTTGGRGSAVAKSSLAPPRHLPKISIFLETY